MSAQADLLARARAQFEGKGGAVAALGRELADALADSVPREQMTADQFREAVGLERASHAARGYDEAHDRAHGVVHLLGWAIDYVARGEAVKSGSLIVAALSVSGDLEREERALRAERDALAHVIEEAPHAPGCRWDRIDARRGPDACTCYKSTTPAVSLARHDAEVKAQALDEAAADLDRCSSDKSPSDRLRRYAADLRELKQL